MEKEKSNNTLKVVFAVVIVALLAVIGVLVYKLTHIPEPEMPQAQQSVEPEGNLFDYDNTAVAIDEDSLARALEEMAKVAEGQMTLEMKTSAESSDGLNFSCELANASENRYDMFLTLYLDETGEELYRSGLIPLGMEIHEFTINRKLNPGTYNATLVYNQVNDDKSTIHSTINVGLTLTVS